MTVIEQRTMEAVQSACRKYANSPIDWEQRRYEIAKDMMVAFRCTDPRYVSWDDEEQLAKIGISYADALIKQLQTLRHDK